MNTPEKRTSYRALLLVTTPRLGEKAAKMFHEASIPIQYQCNAMGTAPNEMIDILGLGSPDKTIMLSIMPRPTAVDVLKKLKKVLRLGSVDSGIAFTMPLTGANTFVVRMLEQLNVDGPAERKDEHTMSESKYSLIISVVDQGYSEEVMDTARAAGAGGGTVVHSRRIGDSEALGLLGMSIQEEKEMLFIVAENDSKLKIMQAIGDKYGIRSEAKGIILSLPIDSVIGLDDD